ncbi:Protein of unknown function [Candidatus Hamiltonella defensa (Bemisia tabaci)]|nr:Protein of unknown function [Candidatus Hamiltonella defensa (Bemisia tabaci)]
MPQNQRMMRGHEAQVFLCFVKILLPISKNKNSGHVHQKQYQSQLI